MSHLELAKLQEQEIYIPVYSRGKQIDKLVAVPGSRPVRTPEGMQFTDSFGVHPAQTEREYRTPMTVEATVMTDSTNIVLKFAKGEVILNWDRREDMLRVKHPAAGQPFDLHGKGAVPIGRWHHLEWIIAEDVMRVLVNGEERFSLPGNYRGLQGKVGVRTGWRANLSVGSLHIEEHLSSEETASTGYRAAIHPDSFAGCLIGAMRYCNRYAGETELLGGVGFWFRSIVPQGELGNRPNEQIQELLAPFGVDTRCIKPAEDTEQNVLQWIKEAIAKKEAVFGCFDEGGGYLAIVDIEGNRLRTVSAEGVVHLVEPEAAGIVYAVRPGIMVPPRERAIIAFRSVAEYGKLGSQTMESEWLSALDAEKSASMRSQAAILTERRGKAAEYLQGCREAVGAKLAEQLDEAARSYREAGLLWGKVAMLLSSNPSEARPVISKAIQAEAEGAGLLGDIAETMAAAKRLAGLRSGGLSSISQHNVFKGIAEYCGVPDSDAWILGASGRPFAFAVHDRVNVHDICLPIPERHFIRLFANIGLTIDGVEGAGQGEEYRQLLEAAWNQARSAIDDGVACFGRSVDFDRGEYSMIIGYDQDGYYTHGWHGPSRHAIPWNMYGLGQCTCLQCTTRRMDWRTEGPVKSVCLCDACQHTAKYGPALGPQSQGEVRLYWAKPSAPAEDRTIVRDALQFAIDFATLKGPWSQPDLLTGMQAYDRLIRALEQGMMDGWYLGLYANGWQECRKIVLKFLREAKRRLGSPLLDGAFDAAICEAEKLQNTFAELYEMFPWMQPFGPIPDTERRYAGAQLLREARKLEAAAIQAYRELLQRLG